MSDELLSEPALFLGFTQAEWVDAYTRFGPRPARASEDVEEFFAEQQLTDGRFLFQLEWVIPMAYANRRVAADLRELLGRLGTDKALDPIQDRAGYSGSDEQWRDHVAAVQEDAARWQRVLADLERHHGSHSLA